MRLASFNVENLFSRVSAFDPEGGAEAERALADFAEFNALVAKPAYGEADRARMLELLEGLGLAKDDDARFVRLRQNRGAFLKRRRKGGALDIVAGGRGDWSGWLELERSPVDETAMRMTAQVIRDVGADVIGVVEAENRPALKGFSDTILPLVGGEPYARVMLIDGNDPRGIDCGLMAREGFPVASMLSHVDAADDEGTIFRRDCPEYHLDTPGGRRLVVLVCHFKSKAGGRRSTDLRRREAAEAARIYARLRAAGSDMVAVVGDFNDSPPSGQNHPLSALLDDTDLSDISALEGHDDGGRPGTFGGSTASNKFDYILLSPALRGRAGASGVFRRGMWPGVRPPKWGAYPEVDPRQGGEERHAASDHAALWVDLDL